MNSENKTESLDPQERRRQNELELLLRELRKIEKMEQLVRERQAEKAKNSSSV